MARTKILRGCVRLVVMLAMTVATVPSWGDLASLQARYLELKEVLKDSKFEAPIYIHTNISKDILSGEVYGMVKNPKVTFEMLSKAFTKLENWCEFIPLHLNVKSCTYSRNGDKSYLTFYVGGKDYAKPDDVYALKYRFQVIKKKDNYFNILLIADKGPTGTRNYRLQLDAMDVDNHICYRIISSYRPSAFSRFGTKIYLKTAGSKKVGFSVIGVNKDGQPIYVRGIRGIVERNVIRYYLAGKTFIFTQLLPPEKQFEARISYWYDETERYHRQLFEMKKSIYLQAKRNEHINQVSLQKTIIFK